MKRNIKLTIEYDGKEFKGWQKQPGRLNIQGEIEKALSEICNEEIELVASGRTDAGVHAIGQVANFKTTSTIELDKIPLALNSKLKKSISIKKAEDVDDRFHSRISCKRKTYRYVINNSKYESAIKRNHETYIPNKMNIDKMKEAITYFVGEHDFKAFCASGAGSKSTVRTIYEAKLEKTEDERIIIELTGNGFLYNMIRIIAGTLIEVGVGNIEAKEIKTIIENKKRENAGKTLLANGLFLVNVEYK